MEMNKKGVFFSLSSLLVVGLLFVTFAQTTESDTQTTLLRVQDFNSDFSQLENEYLPTILRESTKRTLNDIARENALRSSNFLGVEETFRQCLNSEKTQESANPCPVEDEENLQVRYRLDQLQEAHRTTQYYNSSIKLLEVQVEHQGAFLLRVRGLFDIELNETNGFVRQNKLIWVDTTLPIDATFIDPLSSRNRDLSPGEGWHRIRRTPKITDDTEFFFEHARSQTYIFNAEAPSYLQRIVMDNTPNEQNGIMSLIPVQFAEEVYSVDYEEILIEPDECYYRFDIPDMQPPGADIVLPLKLVAGYRLSSLLESGVGQPNNCETT